METPTLKVENLKTYFKTPRGLAKSVDGISFEIPKGSTFALVGESGCGKSVSALSIIQLVPEPAGFIAGGRIFLNGRDIVPLNEREKREIRGNKISMIFQEPMTSLNPVFTIGDQVMETITLHQGKSRAEAREMVIEMLGRVGLPEPERLFSEYPHRLSGGQRQRVMIAMALACRPDLLIADEPTTALDVTIQAQILQLLRELQAEMKMAVLLIAHNLGVVAQFATEVVVMYAGKIVERADVASLFDNALHPYTRGLLLALPRPGRRGQRLASIEGTVPSPLAYPRGCAFAPRCPKAFDPCTGREPTLAAVEPGHETACWLYGGE